MSSTGCEADYKEPIYYLKFSTARATVDVRLNDIPVLHHDAPGMTESEKPVPESIIDGVNTLQVKLTPLKDEENLFVSSKSANVKLIVREKSAPLNQYETLIDLNVKAAENEDQILSDSHKDQGDSEPKLVTSSESEIIAERSTHIKSPFPRWAWQDGLTIEETEANKSGLIEIYREIHSVLSKGSMKEVKGLYAPAASEYAVAYHYDDAEEGHRIINTGEYVGDKDWELGDIEYFLGEKFGQTLQVYANGRLAKIVNKRGNEMLIAYRNASRGIISTQKFGFYKNKDGKWIMIR